MNTEKSKEPCKKRMPLHITKSSSQQALLDYDFYSFSFKEWIFYLIRSLGILAIFTYIFYRNIIAFFLLMPLIPIFMKKAKDSCRKKRKERLSFEFKEMMNSVIAGLTSGYSIENAFINSHKDMLLLFGKNSLIVSELSYISKALRNNRNIEDLLEDFGKRSHVQDIKDFAEIFKIAKRSGGNLPAMIKRTAEIISDKMEIKRKIETIVSAKKYEQSIMNMVPFGIILYIDMTTPGFFNSLYNNLIGIIIMTAMLAIYIAAYLIAEKITDISV